MKRVPANLDREEILAGDLDIFIQENYDVFIQRDASVRAFMYRIFRYIVKTEQFCAVLTHNLVHLLVLVDFEKKGVERFIRDESRKLIKVFLDMSPKSFPIELASSLVAVAGAEGDQFRKVALEYLCTLATVNYEVVVLVNGFKTMLDAVLDPAMSEVSENILIAILFLLDDPRIRAVVQPCVDIKSILSPFIDFDSAAEPISERKRSRAKAAIITIMRTWTGLMLFTSDTQVTTSQASAPVSGGGAVSGGASTAMKGASMKTTKSSDGKEPGGLKIFVDLLENKGVPKVIQEDILDCITELFGPLVSNNGGVLGASASREFGAVHSFTKRKAAGPTATGGRADITGI